MEQTDPEYSEHSEESETVDPLEVTEHVDELGTQEQMMNDPKWNGIPPVGDRPISKMKFPFLNLYGKNAFLLMILLVFEILLDIIILNMEPSMFFLVVMQMK